MTQMVFTDIFRAFHPKATEYTFFLRAHGTFSRIDHITGSQIRSQLVPKDWDHSLHIFRPQCSKTRTQPQEGSWMNSNTWRLKSVLLKNGWVNQEIKEELKIFMETNENENITVQNLWDATKMARRGKYIALKAFLKK